MGSSCQRRTPLTDLLVERIGREGPLTFAAFMDACLYHPQHGYYTRHAADRPYGDYFTSPDVGPLFGRLLARQFHEMWDMLGQPGRFDLLEWGGSLGRLARQVLDAAQGAPEFFAALRLTLVEASPSRRVEAQAALEAFGERVCVAAAPPAEPVAGCILSNELVDALPVHRVVRRPIGLREIYVTVRNGELAEEEGELSTPVLADYLRFYGAPLEEGQLAEVHLPALDWLEKAAAALERGFVVTIDYGYRARELYSPARLRGTVMAYRQHRAHEDWLSQPGLQDLTAHVNFTALEEHGRKLGLEPLGLTTQTNFLLALARAGNYEDLGAADACASDQLMARLAFRQLIHPAGMGETFKVLIQAKGFKAAWLSGLGPL